MFATLVPKSENLVILAGLIPDQNKLIISVVSPTPQEVWTSYEEISNFRENYCYNCSWYEDNNEFESGLDYEDFFDEVAYQEALDEARESVNPDDYETMEEYEQELQEALDNVYKDNYYDGYAYERELAEEKREWEYSLCSGGRDVLDSDDCREYTISDITSRGSVLHTTLPHVYQYTHVFGRQLPSHDRLALEDRFGDDDALFAIREVAHPLNGEKIFQCAPYEVGNVFNNGNICWGENELLTNVRLQYNLFWSSTFNNDLVPDSKDISYWLEVFHQHADFLKWTIASPPLLFGEHGISSDEKTEREIEGILFVPTFKGPDSNKLDLSRTLLTWIFKDDEGQYFAYNTLLPQRPIIRLTMEEGYFDSIKL